MIKPSFYMVGAAKAGTTSLFDYLTQHPSIFVPPMKEPHFFSDYHHRGAPKLDSVDDYLELYRKCRDDQIAGDLSTSYLYSRRAADRIRELRPDAKIVIVLRNPVERAYSFYWYNRNKFVEKLGFEEALDAETRRIAEGWHFRFHYVESGKYHEQVQRYFDTFGPDAVRVYLFEDLTRDTAALSRDIMEFLGVPSDLAIRTDGVFNRSGVYRSDLIGRVLSAKFPGQSLIRRVAPNAARRLKHRLLGYNMRRAPEMEERTRARLREAFRDDVDRLSTLLNRNLSHWTGSPARAPLPSASIPVDAPAPP